MSRSTLAGLLLLSLGAAAQQGAPPPIQNGRVETRQASTIDREIAALSSMAVAEPLWTGWRVPIADGQRGGCCTYSDDANVVRGCFVENTTLSEMRDRPAVAAAANAPVPLDAGTGLIILARVTGGGLERLRTLGDDCPLDAGGHVVYWLQGITAAESLKYLDSVIQRTPNLTGTAGQAQRLRDAALSAAAFHRDAGADALLDRLAGADTDSSTRRLARSLLGSRRGAHGFAALRQLLEQERLPEIRRQLITAIGQSSQPATAEVLAGVARRDWDAKVRAEAAYWLPQRGGAPVIADLVALINADDSDAVKQRAVQGLGRLSTTETTSALIQLATSSPSAVVKKEAVSALGRSKDPKAVAFLEDIIKR